MKQIFILLCMCGKKKNIKQQFKIQKIIYTKIHSYIYYIYVLL